MSNQMKFELWVANRNIRGDAYSGACQGWHGCAESMQAEIDKRNVRIAQLEETLKEIATFPRHRMPADIAKESLSTSSNAWLTDKIKEAEAKERERCAVVCDNLHGERNGDCAEEIRNLK